MTKVSIVIPIYNVQDYLKECMESVIGQTLESMEIICVNDGSTDQSLDIIKSFQAQDNRIVLLDQKNRGYGYAVNRGSVRPKASMSELWSRMIILLLICI